MVFEMRGMDQILGVVKLVFEFDVSNCSAVVLVAFLRSVAKDRPNERSILTHGFSDGGYGPDTRGSQARLWI